MQVLYPMNRGGLGARALNAALQEALNPPSDKPMVERFGYIYRPGDKVMQNENDYDKEPYNGDLGLVESIDLDAQEMTISFDGRAVVYQFGELDQAMPPRSTNRRVGNIPPSSSRSRCSIT